MTKILLVVALFGLVAISTAVAGDGASKSKLGVRNGVITACVEVKNQKTAADDTVGDIKLSNCEPGFKTLRWNIKGPRGLKGAKGATGATGPVGPDSPDPNDPEIQDAEIQDAEINDPDPNDTLLRLEPPFGASNASVATTFDGVQFGPYADGGAAGGSVFYNGANGLTLADLTQLSYTIKYSTSNDVSIGAPYLRIFLSDDNHDVIFDPTLCATATVPEDVFNTFEVTTSEVRYDDDPCNSAASRQSWATVVAAHGGEHISGIYVTTGFSGGENLSAILRTLKVNGTTFTFGAA